MKPEDLPSLVNEVFPKTFDVSVRQFGASSNDMEVRVGVDLFLGLRPRMDKEASDVTAELLAHRDGFIDFCISELSKLKAAK